MVSLLCLTSLSPTSKRKVSLIEFGGVSAAPVAPGLMLRMVKYVLESACATMKLG